MLFTITNTVRNKALGYFITLISPLQEGIATATELGMITLFKKALFQLPIKVHPKIRPQSAAEFCVYKLLQSFWKPIVIRVERRRRWVTRYHTISNATLIAHNTPHRGASTRSSTQRILHAIPEIAPTLFYTFFLFTYTYYDDWMRRNGNLDGNVLRIVLVFLVPDLRCRDGTWVPILLLPLFGCD